MGKFDAYKVDLKGMQQDTQTQEYLLDNQFFAAIEGEDIPKGKIKVSATITKTAGSYVMNFTLKGIAVIPCDRCLDDMDFPIDTTARLVVKLGDDYAEESDDVVVIPEKEGVINLAWFLYEFAALSIPLKHVHGVGKCNKQMTAQLNKHRAVLPEDMPEGEDTDVITDEDSDENTDPRWDALKDLKID